MFKSIEDAILIRRNFWRVKALFDVLVLAKTILAIFGIYETASYFIMMICVVVNLRMYISNTLAF